MAQPLWHTLDVEKVQELLKTDAGQGLSEKEVRTRLLKFGRNALETSDPFRMLRTIFKQLISPLSLVLIAAGIATLFLGEYLDAIVISIAVLVSVVVGAVQEGRASRVFETLAASQEETATVIRDGAKHLISSKDVVPGDVILINRGEGVVADVRLFKTESLSINESALTGEWIAVNKSIEPCKEGAPIVERNNMAWSGTIVTEGIGWGLVVATGERTELGSIARDTQEVEEGATPLQKSVRRLARLMMLVIAIAIAMIVAIGILRGEPFAEMLLIAIAVAVAAMPEGLPAAVTVVLAVGMESILRRGGLVRNLLAAETLGSTTVILTDKTGTLTHGNMAVSALYTARGIVHHDTTTGYTDNHELLKIAALSSDAYVEQTEEGMVVRGKPIEKAVLTAGLDAGISQSELFEHGHKRLDFLAFESARRFGASLHEHPQGSRIYFAGAPEHLLALSEKCFAAGGVRSFDEETRKEFESVQRAESALGNRFIAIAYREHDGHTLPDDVAKSMHPTGLVFVGLIAFADQVRADVCTEIATAKEAGIRVMMLTGDHAETARSVAAQVGIATEDTPVITGRDIEDMSDEELLDALREHIIYARVLPQQKLRIARVLRNAGEVVAMTGDGVNDAPALVSADIGVAVGTGTDVAKEASDLVLLNDTFSTITAAIKEGRRAVDNLRKIIGYLLSTSFSEIIVIGGALAAGAPLPLLPSQILWANLVEEGFMSFPFAFEPAERDVMKRPPRSRANGKDARLVLTQAMRKIIMIVTAVTGVILLVLFFWLLSRGVPIEEIRTIMFVALSLDSIFFAFSFKDLHRPVWNISLINNRLLFGALFVSIALLIAAITVPPLQTLLSLTTLSLGNVVLLAGLGILNLLTIEITKMWVMRTR